MGTAKLSRTYIQYESPELCTTWRNFFQFYVYLIAMHKNAKQITVSIYRKQHFCLKTFQNFFKIKSKHFSTAMTTCIKTAYEWDQSGAGSLALHLANPQFAQMYPAMFRTHKRDQPSVAQTTATAAVNRLFASD